MPRPARARPARHLRVTLAAALVLCKHEFVRYIMEKTYGIVDMSAEGIGGDIPAANLVDTDAQLEGWPWLRGPVTVAAVRDNARQPTLAIYVL